jgi:cobalt-zinc-cadmium efflux system outer membrane protein
MNIIKKKLTVFRGFTILLSFIVFLSGYLFSKNSNPVLPGLENSKSISKFNKKQAGLRIITLDQVIKRVMQKNQILLANKYSILAKEGGIIQASLIPNPEIEVEMENFGGSGETFGFNQAESNVQVSQTILLGRKRKKKVELAKLDKVISLRDYDRKVSNLLSETKKRFVTILHLQKKLKLREEMVEIAELFINKISHRITAGKTSPVELSRAKVSQFRNKLMLYQIKKELSISKQLLAGLWGKTYPDFDQVKGMLDIYSPPPVKDNFKNHLSQNTDLEHLSSQINFQKSILNLEMANRIPNITVLGGIRRLNEFDSTAFTLSVSIPIPIINRNQGDIKTAKFLIEKAKYSYRAAEVRIKNELFTTYDLMQTAYKGPR